MIEMLIVVAIMGVLAGISIPQYLNYRTRARDTAAMTDAGIFKVAAESLNARDGNYNAVTGADNVALFGAGFMSTKVQGRYIRIAGPAFAAVPANYSAVFFHPTGAMNYTVTSLAGIVNNPGMGAGNKHCHPAPVTVPTTCTWDSTAAH